MRKILVLASMLMCMTGSMMAQDLDEKYATDLLPVGTMAPDLIDALDSIHSVADFHGRCVVLDFFATWCGDCRKDLPAMKKLYQQFDIEGVEFIGISFDTDSDVLQNFMDKEPIPWRVLSELKKANKLVAPEMAGQDKAPQYQGGIPALTKFVRYNIKYPVEAEHYGVQGRVYVQFYVGTDGTVSDISVSKTELTNRLSTKAFSKYTAQQKQTMREQGENQLKQEALRVVRKMPKWEAAMRRGKPIRVKYSIPISFKLK